MKQIILEILTQIFGISAASGLHYNQEQLFVIADDSNVLYEYAINDKELTKHQLYPIIEENTAKKNKLDFEAITYHNDSYYIFGSGSKPNREVGAVYKHSNQSVKHLNLDILYPSIASFANIEVDELNIEGALFYKDDLYLFNRGNGKNNRNFIAIIQGNNIEEEFNIVLKDIKLPPLNGMQTGFSDAVLVDDKIYFTATAEGTKSTYNDGKIGGSLFGCIEPKKLKLKYTKVISNDAKIEGITLYKKDKKNLEFLLCDDPDDPKKNTTIYKLSTKK